MNCFLTSIGAHTLWSAPRDVKTLIVVRFIRLLGYGGTTFILASYLRSLGFSDSTTGLFMTATLLGDLAISFVLTYMGDRMGVRLTSAIGSVFMCFGGLTFAWFDYFWILLGSSILGVINPR
jgi:MFS family permease